MRHLVEKLPVMITPCWVKTLTQPIGVDDVVAYLVAGLDLNPPGNLVVDIGAPAMSFLAMLRQTAQAMHLRRLVVPVPLLSPRLSSYWLTLITPVPYRIGSALVEGLKSETLVQNDHARRYFPAIEPAAFIDCVRKACVELENDLVVSRWCDSSAGAVCDIVERAAPQDSIFRDVRTVPFRGIPVEQGWFAYNFLWQLRGLLDKLVGGYGLNRGRRAEGSLRIGDALDFWKVADLVANKRLLLLAQMKLPGKAWLEFDLQQDVLTQTAHFIPHGLLGRLYWYAVLPLALVGQGLGLGNPAAAHGPVQTNQRQMQAGLGLGIAELKIEQAAIRIQPCQVIGITVVVAQAGDPGVIAQRIHLVFLGIQLLLGLLMGGEGIVHLAKTILNSLLLPKQRLLLESFSFLDTARNLACRENGHGEGALYCQILDGPLNRSFKSPLVLPKNPVREMAGKEAALATPI